MPEAKITQPDLLDQAHEKRLAEARDQVTWARHYRSGVQAAQKTLIRTMADILREEIGRERV